MGKGSGGTTTSCTDEEKEFDEEACLTMDEWKEVIDEEREKDEDRKDDERKSEGPHRDAFVRDMIEELEVACEDENNEEACEELQAVVAELEEKEGGCDKERDDQENEESEDVDESEEEETDEDESEQDESEDEESEE